MPSKRDMAELIHFFLSTNFNNHKTRGEVIASSLMQETMHQKSQCKKHKQTTKTNQSWSQERDYYSCVSRFQFKGKNPLHEIFEFEGFYMNFLITINFGHLSLVVPT